MLPSDVGVETTTQIRIALECGLHTFQSKVVSIFTSIVKDTGLFSQDVIYYERVCPELGIEEIEIPFLGCNLKVIEEVFKGFGVDRALMNLKLDVVLAAHLERH